MAPQLSQNQHRHGPSAAGVCAVSGALLVPQLPPPEALLVLVLSHALWAFSTPLAMSILVILLPRLVL